MKKKNQELIWKTKYKIIAIKDQNWIQRLNQIIIMRQNWKT
jgi:hypothetical protein